MNTFENDFAGMRREMVINQLLGRDIKDKKVLSIFEKVPRHKFTGPKFYRDAYGDFPLPIGDEQTISQPYIVALMAQVLDIKENDSVLEIGTGSGYQTAILAELAGRVFSVERIKNLTEKANAVLKEMGYENVTLKTGDGTIGWREFAPFDKIIISASAEFVPEPLMDQLKSPGKLAMPVGPRISQKLLLVEKTDKSDILKKDICACIFVPLIGKYGWAEGRKASE